MLLRACQRVVEAARNGSADFGQGLREARQAIGAAGPEEAIAAAHLLVDASAEVMPQRGGWLPALAGSLAEKGVDVDGIPVVERLSGIAAGAVTFAEAWGPDLPDPAQGPNQQIWERTRQLMGERARIPMQCWYALPHFTKSAVTLLTYSPATRVAVRDHDDVVDRAAEYCPDLEDVRDLRRMLDGEELLILDRPTRRGWSVTIHGIGDDFQLHTLLAAVLVGRALPGTPPDPRWVRCFTTGEVEPGTPPVTGWWRLTDAHGEQIRNEGVPADIPVLGDTRVVVLDPPPYPPSWSPGRRFPLIPGSLTLDATYHPDDLAAWWPILKPPQTARPH